MSQTFENHRKQDDSEDEGIPLHVIRKPTYIVGKECSFYVQDPPKPRLDETGTPIPDAKPLPGPRHYNTMINRLIVPSVQEDASHPHIHTYCCNGFQVSICVKKQCEMSHPTIVTHDIKTFWVHCIALNPRFKQGRCYLENCPDKLACGYHHGTPFERDMKKSMDSILRNPMDFLFTFVLPSESLIKVSKPSDEVSFVRPIEPTNRRWKEDGKETIYTQQICKFECTAPHRSSKRNKRSKQNKRCKKNKRCNIIKIDKSSFDQTNIDFSFLAEDCEDDAADVEYADADVEDADVEDADVKDADEDADIDVEDADADEMKMLKMPMKSMNMLTPMK